MTSPNIAPLPIVKINASEVFTTSLTAVDFGEQSKEVFEHLASECGLFQGRVRNETYLYSLAPMNWFLKLLGKTLFSRTYDRAKFEFNNPSAASAFTKHVVENLYPTDAMRLYLKQVAESVGTQSHIVGQDSPQGDTQ